MKGFVFLIVSSKCVFGGTDRHCVNIWADNGLVSRDKKPSSEPMLTRFCDYMVLIHHNWLKIIYPVKMRTWEKKLTHWPLWDFNDTLNE